MCRTGVAAITMPNETKTHPHIAFTRTYIQGSQPPKKRNSRDARKVWQPQSKWDISHKKQILQAAAVAAMLLPSLWILWIINRTTSPDCRQTFKVDNEANQEAEARPRSRESDNQNKQRLRWRIFGGAGEA